MSENISDDVAEKAAKMMNEHGVTNIIKAKYTKEIAEAVSETKTKIFCQLRPHVVNRTEEAWIETYKLLNKWLNKEKRTLTIETMKIEMNSKKVDFPIGDPKISFKSLIAITRVKPDSLEEKVQDFLTKIPNIKFVDQEETDENTEIKVSSDLSKSEPKFEVVAENQPTKTQKDEEEIDVFDESFENSQINEKEEKEPEKNQTKDNNEEKPKEKEVKEEETKKEEEKEGEEKLDNFSDFSYESIGDTKVDPVIANEPEHTGFTSSSNDDIFISDSFNA